MVHPGQEIESTVLRVGGKRLAQVVGQVLVGVWSSETVGETLPEGRIWAQKTPGAAVKEETEITLLLKMHLQQKENGTENNDVNTQSQAQGEARSGLPWHQSYSLLMKAHRALF